MRMTGGTTATSSFEGYVSFDAGKAIPGRPLYCAGVNSLSESHRDLHTWPMSEPASRITNLSAALGEVIADGETRLAGTDHDDVEGGRSGLGGHIVTSAGSRRDTLKLNIIPLWACSAMWQCAIHSPGLETSRRMSTVCPARNEHRVLPHQVGLCLPVARQDEEATRSVDVERVVHRVIGLHLVHESDLHPVADRECPRDGAVLGSALSDR